MAAGKISGITRRRIYVRTGATPWAPIRMGAVYVLRSALVLGSIVAYTFPVQANGEPSEQNRPVDDVLQAFDDLTHHGEWLGFHNGAGAPPRLNESAYPWDNLCTGSEDHIQGVARSSRPGTPYFFVTSSGRWTEAGPSDGNLMVVEMGSRDASGERLRSNRLHPDAETSCTVPEVVDKVVYNYQFSNYRHPGALHLVGDILVVPLEKPREGMDFCNGGSNHGGTCTDNDECPGGGTCINTKTCQGGSNHGETCSQNDDCAFGGTCDEVCIGGSNHGETCSSDADCSGSCRTLPKSRIQFFDVSDPLAPALLPYSLGVDHGAGTVGLAKLPDGHFLFSLAWGWGEEVEFWRSNKTSFFEPGFKFEWHDTWYPQEPTACSEPWAVCNNTYQNSTLVTQTDDRLFMIAGRNENIGAPIVHGDDLLVLYEITGFEEGGEIEIIQQGQTRVVNFKNDSSLPLRLHPDHPICGTCAWTEATNADLLAGANAYITPSGELLFYAVTHYNDGPIGLGGDPIVRMAELRHIHVVRDGSPTYDVTANAGGPYAVDEGSTIQLDGGLSQPPTAAPWAQLFEHSGFGGQSVMFDYADRNEDDYDNFAKLDGQRLFDVCADSQALADVTLAGQIVDQASGGITVDDFIRFECLGWWQDGECWLVKPTKGHESCAPVVGCACFAALPGQSRDCTLIPGIPGVVGAIPDFNATAWDFLGKLGVLFSKIGVLLQSVEECGRVLDALGSPPPLPGVLEVLNPAHYVDFNIDDLPAFVEAFPDFVLNLGSALADVPGYVSALEDYVNELLESIKGFNNRASSVRWYAPVGVNVLMYQKAHMGGGRLTLPGTGNVEETPDLRGEFLDIPPFPPRHADDLMRSMRFVGTFVSPTLESFVWSIVSPSPSEPLVLHDPTAATPTFDASGGDGPMPATVELVVTDSLGQGATATANVQVRNVAPTIDSIGPDRFIAEGETVALAPVRFSDPGIPDTHTATIDWGDGSPLATGTVTQDVVSGGGEVAGSHAYGDDGTYLVTVTVTDDDGGSGSGVFTVEVTNLDPTLTLDTSGATDFRAGPAFMGRVGAEQFHHASSIDPGSDDLRFVWTALEEVSGDLLDIEQNVYFNNGQGPDPFPSALGTFPFGADDTAEANFPRPGLYLLSVAVTDDDGGSAEAGLPKLVAGDADCPRSIGNWRHQFAERGRGHLGDVTLLGLLSYVNFASSYFSEQLAAQSIAQARAVLQPGGADLGDSGRAKQRTDPGQSNAGGKPNRANMRGKAVQRLFAVWLSAASGALDLHEVLPDGATVLEALYAAEDILADPSTTHREHILIMQRMTAINKRGCP